MSRETKTIKLLLNDGSLKGLMNIVDSVWFSGELYSAPRAQINELIQSDACKRYGVYLLLSNEKVYIGQASDLSKRIQQHIIGKDWWERVIVLTTDNNSFNHSDIDYLESYLIKKAKESGKIDTENKVSGAKPKVDKFREPELEKYLEEALFLLELIGVKVFNTNGNTTGEKSPFIETVEIRNNSSIQKRSKSDAISFLKSKNIIIDNNCTYATLLENKKVFWANPRTNLLNEDWSLILNNCKKCQILFLHIPANSLKCDSINGLRNRKDKPYYIDLNLDSESLIDSRSKIDFSPYIKHRVDY